MDQRYRQLLAIPHDRLEKEIVQTEIRRILSLGVKIEKNFNVTRQEFQVLYDTYDGFVIAVGAHNPRMLKFPGSEHAISALAFLNSVNAGAPVVNPAGKSVVVIGAGDVGMDVCAMAWKLGAKSVKAVDIQEPASSSRERTTAMALGTEIIWPRVTREYVDGQLYFESGEPMEADVLIVSIGEVPITDWLPDNLGRVKGNWIPVDEVGRTRDPKVFAVGDVVKPGLLTQAIGAGRIAALALHAQVTGDPFELPHKQAIPQERLNLIYFTPRLNQCPTDPLLEGDRCISCGTCRDCNICVYICGQNAITRYEHPNGAYEFRVEEDHATK